MSSEDEMLKKFGSFCAVWNYLFYEVNGALFRKVTTYNNSKVDDKVGYVSNGYLKTGTMGKQYYCHRIVFQMYGNEIANGKQIDHVDGNRKNNSISNLRLVDASENQRNRTHSKRNATKLKGVTLAKNGKYEARIMVRGGRHHLGTFNDMSSASNAYDLAASKLHGDFSKLNNLENLK